MSILWHHNFLSNILILLTEKALKKIGLSPNYQSSPLWIWKFCSSLVYDWKNTPSISNINIFWLVVMPICIWYYILSLIKALFHIHLINVFVLLACRCRLHNDVCGWASKKWSLQVDLTNKIYVAVSDLQSLEKLPLGGGLGDENYVNQFLPYGRRCASPTWGLLPRAPIARSMKFHWGMHMGIMIIIAVMSIITTSPRCYCSPPIGPRFTGYLKLYEASSLAAGNCGLLLNLLICWSLCNLSNFRSLVKPQY